VSSELPPLLQHPEGSVVNHKLLPVIVDSLSGPDQVDTVRVEALIVGVRRRRPLERRHHYQLLNWNGSPQLMPGLPPPPALKVVREDRTHVRGVLKPVKRLMHGLLEATVQQLLRPVQRQTRGLSLEVPHQRQMIGPLLGPATQLPEVVHHWPIIGLLPEAVIQLPEVVRREQMLGLLHLEQRIPEHLLEVVGVVKEGPILGNAVVLELVMVRIPGPHRAVMAIRETEVAVKNINVQEKLRRTRGIPLKRVERIVTSRPRTGDKPLTPGSLPKRLPVAHITHLEKVKTNLQDCVHEHQLVIGTLYPIRGPLLPLLVMLLKLEPDHAPRQNRLIGKQLLISGRVLHQLVVRGPHLLP